MTRWILSLLILVTPAWAQTATRIPLPEPRLWCPVEPPAPYLWSQEFQIADNVSSDAPYTVGRVVGPGSTAPCGDWYVAHADGHDLIPEVGCRFSPYATSDAGVVFGSRGYGWGYYSNPSSDGTVYRYAVATGLEVVGPGHAVGASSDGAVSVGWYWPEWGSLRNRPCWWDTAGERYDLPTEGGYGRTLAVTGDGTTIYGLDWEADYGNWHSCRWVDGVQYPAPDIPANTGQLILSPNGTWALRTIVGSSCYTLWHGSEQRELPRQFAGVAGRFRWYAVADTGRVCGMWTPPQPSDPDVPWHYAVVWQSDWRCPVTIWEMMPAALRADWHSLDKAHDIDSLGHSVVGNGQQWREVDGEPKRVARAFVARLPNPWPPLRANLP